MPSKTGAAPGRRIKQCYFLYPDSCCNFFSPLLAFLALKQTHTPSYAELCVKQGVDFLVSNTTGFTIPLLIMTKIQMTVFHNGKLSLNAHK